MEKFGASIFIRIIFFTVFLIPILACVDPTLFSQIEKLIATLETIEETIDNFLVPVRSFCVEPGRNTGELVLSWEHPMGAKLNYDLFYHDSPITEENWHIVNVKHLRTRDIAYSQNDGTYSMFYTWDDFPTRQKIWVVIRQSFKGVQQIRLFIDMLGPIMGFELPEKTWQIPPSVLASSNQLSLIDNGFRPDADGYSFRNSRPQAFDFPVTRSDYIEMLRWVYGDADVCIVLAYGRCFPRHSANRLAKKNITVGQCSGFTTTSGMFYLNMANRRDYINSSVFSNDTINIRPSSEIFKFIMAYQQLQGQPNISAERARTRFEELHTQLNGLEELMLDHRSLPNLGLRPNTSKCSGHSILPYLIVSDSVTWANVWVYDNNHVRDKSKVVIYDLSNSTWVYEFSNGVNWHSTVPANNSKYCGSIGHFNVSSYLNVDDGGYIGLAPWRNRRKTVVTSTSDAVLITASDGSSIGVNYDGEIITEVSDALIDVIDLEGTMLMLLPEDDYVFSVHTSASDRSGFIIMGDQETFAAESISAGDIFSISAGSIKYESSIHQTQPNIAIILEEESRSSAFSVQPNMSVGHQLIVQYNPETLDFRLSTTESMVYALDLDVITPEGYFDFVTNRLIRLPMIPLSFH